MSYQNDARRSITFAGCVNNPLTLETNAKSLVTANRYGTEIAAKEVLSLTVSSSFIYVYYLIYAEHFFFALAGPLIFKTPSSPDSPDFSPQRYQLATLNKLTPLCNFADSM